MVIMAALLGLLGLASILLKKTVLGILVGFQLLMTGATLFFVVSGAQSNGHPADAQAFGIVILLGAVAQLAGGLALAIRMFYLKGSDSLDEMRALKQ